MSKKNAGPQIKRSHDHAKKKEDADTWTASKGGNVLSWLAQRAPQQPSRGAIDYLNKAQTADKPVASQGALPKPRSQQTPAPDQDAVSKLLKLFPDKEKDPVPEQKQEKPHEEGEEHSVRSLPRGRRRRETKEERLKRKFDRMAEDAQKKHEEALRTDPEYKQNFQTLHELQAAQQITQTQFFERYGRQEHLSTISDPSERLDIPVILDLIDKHDVVFICTDTGTGKSTCVPKALLELSNDTRVVSTMPRRTATISIATRVAGMRRENVGEDVGYWIRGDKRGDDQTRLWYMTSYTLLLYLLNNPLHPPFTHIVLDEFHERQPDIEVTVALLRMCLMRKTADFKLILMSATLSTDAWEDYFAGLKVATYKQSEPDHPIYDYFMEDVCAILGTEYKEPPNILERGVDYSLLENHMLVVQNLIMYLNAYAHPQHAILVFLPGRAQVEQLQTWLEMNIQKPMDIVSWHSTVDLSIIEAAIQRRSPYAQKIYLATDIAEVSITLPDVVFVIDTVLVKRPKITKSDPATVLHPPLITQWISKGSVSQRRGRIGRVQQGFYFCLLHSSSVTKLPDHAHPPIENSRVDELSLHCLQLVANPVAIFSICHGQPLLETITASMDTLSHLGCIMNQKDPLAAGERLSEMQSNSKWSPLILEEAKNIVRSDIDQYECTFIGRMLQFIPVSPQSGMLVFYGFLTGLESLMILAAAITSSMSPFSLHSPDQKRRKRHTVTRAMEAAENVMRDMCCGLRSDIVSVMKAVILFRVCLKDLGDNTKRIQQWCLQHNLSHDKLRSILDLEEHIKFELVKFIPFRDVVDPQELLAQLEKAAPIVLVMTNAAFVSQSLEVTSEGNMYKNSKETAVGLFTDVTAVPDIHSPSCIRWQEGDIIVPVQLSILSNRMLASFATAITSHKQFWLSILLLTYRLKYAIFSDEDGAFFVFSVRYHQTEKFIETDAQTGYAVVYFRQQIGTAGQTVRLLHDHQELYDDEFATLLQRCNLKSLHETQREVLTSIATLFNNTDSMTVDEVEHEDDDLDEVSIITLGRPSPLGP